MDYSAKIYLENAVKVRFLQYWEGKSSASLHCENSTQALHLQISLITYLDIAIAFQCECVRLVPMKEVAQEIKDARPPLFDSSSFLLLFEGGERTYSIAAHKIDAWDFDQKIFDSNCATPRDEVQKQFGHIFPK